MTYLYGTTVVLKFGDPRLEVWQVVKRERNSYRSRSVFLKGQWELTLSECGWRILVEDDELAHSESPHDKIRQACAILQGQAFESIRLHPPTGRARFYFDLGGLVETLPYEQDEDDEGPEEQWSLIQPGDRWYSYREDGMACIHGGNRKQSEGDWFPAR